MEWKVLVGLVLLLIVYMLLGGVGFHFLERPNEQQVQAETYNITQALLDANPCLTEEEIYAFVGAIITAYDSGVIVKNDSSDAVSNWDFASSIFFAGTVVTTIGYGNISPGTNGGRAFFVFYAMIGIPLCLILVGGIGENLKEQNKRLHEKLDVCKKRPKLGKALRTITVCVLGVTLFIFIPAIIFTAIEGWSYGTALYYGVVTLSTVGFGDYVAGQDLQSRGRGIYRICVWVWIFIGLAWLATLLSTIQESMQTVVTKAEERVHDAESSNSTSENSPEKVELSEPGVNDKKDLEAFSSQGNNNTNGALSPGENLTVRM